MTLPKKIVGPLRCGNRGEDVRTVQATLNAVNTPPSLAADGKFGNKTHKAVVAFQRKKGLRADGVVGPKTAASLGLGYTSSPALLHPGPRRRPPPNPSQVPTLPRPPLPQAAPALEIIADGLSTEFEDYFLVIAWEIRRAGGNPEKVTNAVAGLTGVRDGLLDKFKTWGSSEIDKGTAVSLSRNILESTNLVLREIGPYLKKHGSETNGLATRLERLDTTAIERAVQGMIDGDKTAEEAMGEIRVTMDNAIRIAP